jgi:hypothetical protein
MIGGSQLDEVQVFSHVYLMLRTNPTATKQNEEFVSTYDGTLLRE